MEINLKQFRLCPKCGSTDFLENYPSLGMTACAKCLGRTIKIPLTEINEDKLEEQNCSHCDAEGEEDDTLFDSEEIVVFKCKKCGTIDGYSVKDDYYYDYGGYDFDYDDGSYSFKSIDIAQKEGTNALSTGNCKKIAKAIKKREKDPKEQNKKQLLQLKKQKTVALEKIGITERVISDSAFLAQMYISKNGAVTQNQLIILFAASIRVSEEMLFRRKDILTCNTTERNISEIFGIDRNTLRKWTSLLEREKSNDKIRVRVYRPDGQLESAVIKIPEDIVEVVKLEPSYVGRCCFALGCTDRLCWRIKYRNNTWSDIRLSAYENFKKDYWENKGTLTLP